MSLAMGVAAARAAASAAAPHFLSSEPLRTSFVCDTPPSVVPFVPSDLEPGAKPVLETPEKAPVVATPEVDAKPAAETGQ